MKKVAKLLLAATAIAAAIPAAAQDSRRDAGRTACAGSADERQRRSGYIGFYVGSDELLPWGKAERCAQPARGHSVRSASSR